MLILSRREQESFTIPRHDIEVVVVRIDGDKVRLGIKAPDHVGIYRAEVWQAICHDAGRKEIEKGTIR